MAVRPAKSMIFQPAIVPLMDRIRQPPVPNQSPLEQSPSKLPSGHGAGAWLHLCFFFARRKAVVTFLLYEMAFFHTAFACGKKKTKFDTILIWIIFWIIEDVLSKFNVNDIFLFLAAFVWRAPSHEKALFFLHRKSFIKYLWTFLIAVKWRVKWITLYYLIMFFFIIPQFI